jgi:hypothetical protein
MTADGATARQKRAIFFVFDGGTGLGHLRRLSCIARALQGQFACLIVTGHRASANWFVPPECEHVHVPARDSLLVERRPIGSASRFCRTGPTRRHRLAPGAGPLSPPEGVSMHLRTGFRSGVLNRFPFPVRPVCLSGRKLRDS